MVPKRPPGSQFPVDEWCQNTPLGLAPGRRFQARMFSVQVGLFMLPLSTKSPTLVSLLVDDKCPFIHLRAPKAHESHTLKIYYSEYSRRPFTTDFLFPPFTAFQAATTCPHTTLTSPHQHQPHPARRKKERKKERPKASKWRRGLFEAFLR